MNIVKKKIKKYNKNKNDTVSVIIPTWNRSDLLKKAIRSVLNQSVAPLEIIISDDGSTDDTLRVVRSFNNPKIKWLSDKHLGLPAVVRNRAIRVSSGEWLAFIDSDDEWHPKKLEKQLKAVKKSNYKVICCNAYGIDSDGNRKIYLNYRKDTISFYDLIQANHVVLSSAMIHRSLLKKCKGFPEGQRFRNAPDYAFWLRASTQTCFAYSDEILVNYLDEPEKSIRRFTTNPFLQKKIILENFIRWSWSNNIPIIYLMYAIKQYILNLPNVIWKLLYDILKNIFQLIKTYKYYNYSFFDCIHINCNNKKLLNNNLLDIVTVSFNNPKVIYYQFKLFKKNIIDPYCYTVVDNSDDPKKQQKILELCEEFKVSYIKAPDNPYLSPSMAHGATLNWIYKNYIKPRGARYWGFVDHDIFPIKPVKIIYLLKDQYIYGHRQERNDIWYLWAGLCFYNSIFVRSKAPDFLPDKNIDTGGRNYKILYENIEHKKIYFPKHRYLKLREGNIPQSDMIEYIDNWMHVFNASGWKIIKKPQDKSKMINHLLDKYLGSV